MGKIKNKVFGLVVSKNVTDSLDDSVKEGNQAKFYLAQEGDAEGKALDEVTSPDEFSDRNLLIINGNIIQGVSKDDLTKLNAIPDATKIFKYKGSVKTGEDLLKKVPPEAEVGDVWNVEQECEIDGNKYPPHTNFVCSSIKILPASSTWDSLGGTMISGESAYRQITYVGSDVFIKYKTVNKTPINSFSIKLDATTGISANSEGTIKLNLGTADIFYVDHNPNSYDSLVISTSVPMCGIKIPIGLGLKVSTQYGIGVKLSTRISTNIDLTNRYRNGGLDMDGNGLFIAISSSGILESQYIPNGLKCVEMDTTNKLTGGLILDGDNIADWLQAHKKLESYINSLIDAKLKAQ